VRWKCFPDRFTSVSTIKYTLETGMNRITAISGVLVAALASTWCSAAHAQSVTLYGIIDTGIEYVNHANPRGGSRVRVPGTTGALPSRWGLKGSEPLGDHYNAVFTLESGFATGT